SDPIHKATIIPRGRALGMVMRLPERDSYSYHRDKMHANLAVAMGGRVAEEIIFGYNKVSSGASGDIQYATKLARDMVTQWGMSDELGPLQYEEPQGETFLGYSQSQRVHMSDETAKKIDTEIRRIVDSGYDRAKSLLAEHEDQLHLLANALQEYETLSGDEINALLDRGEFVRTGNAVRPVAVPVTGTSIPKSGGKRSGPFSDPRPQGI
ncbi:MAG: cell division protein FtsH, partial [Sphingobium sp.]